MKSDLLYIFTRTPLHVGSGGSVGVVDQPIQRERHTGYPIIPGSSIKGVLRDHFAHGETLDKTQLDAGFGKAEEAQSDGQAGLLSFMEARLLAFPLRSARGTYAMATCPLALERYRRDSARADLPQPEAVSDGQAFAGSAITLQGDKGHSVALEEYAFSVQSGFPQTWADHLSSLLDDAVLQGAKNRFVLISDGDFSHFAQAACQVSQHIRIDEETGTVASGALFNMESTPSETLFYSVVTSFSRPNAPVANIEIPEQLIQFGGNSTTGMGLCTVKLQSTASS